MRSLILLYLSFVLLAVSFAMGQENSAQENAERVMDSVLFYAPIVVIDVDPDVVQAQFERYKVKRVWNSLIKNYAEKEMHQVNATLDSLRDSQPQEPTVCKEPEPSDEFSLKSLFSLHLESVGENEKARP